MTETKIKVKSIYVIILLLIPLLFLSVNFEKDFVTASKETNDSFTLANEGIITDPLIINSAPPIIAPPTIEYDSNGDGQGPCADDSPLVTASITDDGNVTRAYVYSAEFESTWFVPAVMQQSESDETIWSGSIPTFERGIRVKWFVEAWDDEDQDTWNPHFTNPNTYTVINGAPIVELTFLSGGTNFTSNSLNITWTATDPDDDPLTFDIYYNRDDKGWKPIIEDIDQLSYVWDKIKYSDSYRIKVVADDGNEGITEAITPDLLTIGEADFAPFSVLIMSLVVITSISIYFKKKRRK